ncbi:putative E3 ubiquitin-protein ligase UBR7 [Macrosteles quadrilineatus]|uniref:putative E3 ubiquitin-protein ligase UBR7 n=1 Tax=Macrosteles quadrilineatus TaxID=74068 RepID=UPI0023E09D43|nr:putative E3 ubiquitin-protein ligase UBR7 [Macrosteles quadrilineatus]
MAENKLSNINESNECDEDGIVTMVDVLKAEEILEENADAVLGPGDDKNCTYNEGYLKRQALYSCLTCLPGAGPDRAGLCLACSYHCHADHELVELYTKRNFRCDCGTSLFKGRHCTLDPLKTGVNEKNVYNQNFRGVYCTCSRPYPDPEDSVEDEMIQCIICEDWYHTRHLTSAVPKEDDYAEMICSPCTDKLPFLQYYLGYAVSKVSKEEEKEGDVSVTEENTSLESSLKLDEGENLESRKTSILDVEEKQNSEEKTCPPQSNSAISKETKDDSNEVMQEADVSANEKETASSSDIINGCKLKSLKMLPRDSGATFWPENFRKLLCVCSSCKETYASLGVLFLTDEGDTVRAYEEEGKARKRSAGAGVTQYERGMEALSSLDRVQQMEAILSYNEMKTHLSEYLAKFVENKKVVREEDIREFFTGMQARKRQKTDVPYNCR